MNAVFSSWTKEAWQLGVGEFVIRAAIRQSSDIDPFLRA
ncbi:hypothetical protein ACVIJ6_001298 [Bradyrhizobium sp. USDA 4369]